MTDETTTSDNTDTDETAGRARTRTRTRRRSAGSGSGGGGDADTGSTSSDSRARKDSGKDSGRDSGKDAGKGSGKGSGDDSKGSGDDSGKGSGRKSSGKDASSGDDGDGGGGSSRKRRSRRGRRGRGRSSKSSSSSKKSGNDKGSGSSGKGGNGSGGSDDDSIRPGGTRLAAKRGRSGGGGGGRSGGGGGRRGKVQGVPEDVRRAMLDGPPKTMLVSVSDDRTQIAILEDRVLFEHNVTRKSDVTLVGNIYMARVQNVLPGMEAAFLDIGKGRNGVLYAGEVLYDDLDIEEGDTPRIEDALQSGQKVLVQVTKDAMGTKGPRLTMQLSLAGRYTVLAPNSDVFGISRKLTDKERDRLRKIVKKVKPSEHGVIVRTAAEDIPEDQLVADLERLLRKWERVEAASEGAKALTCVYEEPPLHVKVIRDTFGPDFDKCIIDDLHVYDAVTEYLGEVAPDLAANIELYGPARYERDERDKAAAATATADTAAPDSEAADSAAPDAETAGAETAGAEAVDAEPAATAEPTEPTEATKSRFAPLFDAYNVTEQLRKAMGRKVWLPSGGYLIIEATEAMKVVDVNTGKYTGNGKQNLEEVVLKTNLEAAEEIVRQLRLRDIGGIIIIDFIDMLLKANQEQVVRKLKRELLRDRTKTRVSDVSRLGLVQMTRKNVSAGLVESFSRKCEVCEGRGFVNEFD